MATTLTTWWCLCHGLLLLLSYGQPTSSANGVQQRAPRITENPADVTVAKNDPATLSCAADGQPPPIIEWYRDGELIAMGSSVSGSQPSDSYKGHRMLLPGGSLFFLKVVHSRKENDGGTYWCVARNAAGMARSKNATLTVAYFHTEFRAVPEATRGILGEPTSLECLAPRGHPEPQIRWKKNGHPLELQSQSDRIRIDGTGNLIFTKLIASDEGRYQCTAQNAVATRETAAVLLSVHVRPTVVRPPQDVTALVGSDATFECGASGDPTPHVVWRRLDGALPAGRARSTESRTGLRIERVQASDSGRYVCEVENSVGATSATAVLTVLIPPTLNVSSLPKEVRTHLDQQVFLDCLVHGTPAPSVFWSREGRSPPELLTADSSSSSRWIVFANGTLMITNMRRDDAGPLWCGAVNDAGSLVVRTRLEIVTTTSPPPVVIEVGPANQTLPLKSPASLPCQAEGQPVKWLKDGQPVNATLTLESSAFNRPRVSITDMGTLRIEDLQPSDAGIYTCWCGKDDQTVSAWTATLMVASPTNPNVVFVRSPSDPMALPGSPSQPRLLHRTSNSLAIGWQSSSRMGASPLLGYTVEMFSSAMGESDEESSTEEGGSGWTWGGQATGAGRKAWRIVARRLKADQLVLTDLNPATSYTFLVRAENSHGLSLPSPASQWFTTLPSGGHQLHSHQWQSAAEMEEARHRLSSSAWVRLEQVKAVNATAIRLNWRLLDGDGEGEAPVEGLYVWYRPLGPADDGSSSSGSSSPGGSFTVATIVNPSASAYTLSQLTPFTRYVFFLVPFYRNIEGRPSNSKTESTLEAAPHGPPRDLLIRQVNSSSAIVRWSEPVGDQRNGVITSYQLYVDLEGSEQTNLANLTLPAMPTSVVIGGLIPGTSYSIRAAAWTSAGLGPASPPTNFLMDAVTIQRADHHPGVSSARPRHPSSLDDGAVDLYDQFDDPSHGITSDVTQVVQETWFILVLGGVLLTMLVLLIAALIVRRRWARKKALSSVQKAGEHPSCDDHHSQVGRGRDLIWSRGWHTGATAPSNVKEAELEAQTSLLGPQYANSMTRGVGCGVPPPEYAELLNHNNQEQQPNGHLSLSSFLPRRANNMMIMQHPQQHPPSAYATTTLVTCSSQRSHHGPYSMSIGSGTAAMSNSKSSESSSGGCSDSGAGQRQHGHRSRKNSNGNSKVPNWADLLPPPPRHPPPPSPAPLNNDRSSANKDCSLPHSVNKPHPKMNSPQLQNGGCASPALSKRSVAGSNSFGISKKSSNQLNYNISLGKSHTGSCGSSSGSKDNSPSSGNQRHRSHGPGYAKSNGSSSGRWPSFKPQDSELKSPSINGLTMEELEAKRHQPPCSPAPGGPKEVTKRGFPDVDLVPDYSDGDSYYAAAHSLSYGELDYNKIQDLSAYRPDNTTSEWDCEDYSRTASEGSDTEDDLASSVYDNSPVYRPATKSRPRTAVAVIRSCDRREGT